MPWYVLYTKPRSEKKLAKLLEFKNIVVYCPVQEVIKQWSDRKKKVIEPVFRSYIFVYFDDYTKENVNVLETSGAVRFLWWLGKPGIVRNEEIEEIKKFLNDYSGAIIETGIQEGQDVVINEGIFKEQSGTVVKVKGNTVTLHIKSIGLNIMAQIPVSQLSMENNKG